MSSQENPERHWSFIATTVAHMLSALCSHDSLQCMTLRLRMPAPATTMAGKITPAHRRLDIAAVLHTAAAPSRLFVAFKSKLTYEPRLTALCWVWGTSAAV